MDESFEAIFAEEPASRPIERDHGLPSSALLDHAWQSVAAFVGVGVLGVFDSMRPLGLECVFLLASLGASAVLVFGLPESPMAKPRSVVGGHVVSALVGVTCFKLAGTVPWLSGALAVALALFAMERTGTTHPPGGATALLANIGPAQVKALGYAYVLTPVLAGASLLVLVAALFRRARASRSLDVARRRATRDVARDQCLREGGVRRREGGGGGAHSPSDATETPAA